MKWGEYIVQFKVVEGGDFKGSSSRLISFFTGTKEDCEMYALGANDVLEAFGGEHKKFKVELTKTGIGE